MNDSSLLPNDIRIRDAVEAVYREFAAPAPSAIEGCPCCIGTRGVDALLTVPLRRITGEQLWRYVSGVFLTIGSERDFRYLLPRILDISVSDPGKACDPEIVIGKLGLANWQSWSASERQAIEALVDCWFDLALARDLAEADDWCPGQEAEGVLCGAARAGLSLERWRHRLHDPLAAPVLEDLKQRLPTQLSAFWKDAPDGLRELSAILVPGCR